MDAQNLKRSNRDIKCSKSRNIYHEITGLTMLKATEVERKIREINLLIDMQINLASCRTSAIVMGLVRN